MATIDEDQEIVNDQEPMTSKEFGCLGTMQLLWQALEQQSAQNFSNNDFQDEPPPLSINIPETIVIDFDF